MFTRRMSYFVITFFLAAGLGHAQQRTYDFVISGARIVAIGDLHGATATKRIDATGLVASPGFIDVQGQSEFNVLVDNRAASKITQGVTTEITGEGTSIAISVVTP